MPTQLPDMSFWEPEPHPSRSFEVFGVELELTLGDPDLESAVEQILPPGWKPCTPTSPAGRFGLWPATNDEYDVTFNDAPIVKSAPLRLALTLLDSQMGLFVAVRAPDLVFVRAGAVVLDDRALVIPGESFSGKTTLVAALVDAGAHYHSDEYAVLDEDGRVHPYPRSLSLRSNDGKTPEQLASSDDDGGAPAMLGALVLTRYRPGSEWNPREVSRGQGIAELMAQALPALERPEQSLRTLRRAMSRATVLESDRGEAATVAGPLLDKLAAIVQSGQILGKEA